MIRGVIKIFTGVSALIIGLIILVLFWGYHLVAPQTPRVDTLVGKWEDTLPKNAGGLQLPEPHHSVLDLNSNGSFSVTGLPYFEGPWEDRKVAWSEGSGTWKLLKQPQGGYYVDLNYEIYDGQRQKNPSHEWLDVNLHWEGKETKLWYVWDDPDIGDEVVFEKEK